MSLITKIRKLPHKIRQFVSDDIVELNDLSTIRDAKGNADFSYTFRKKVIGEGYIISKLYAVYWQGWECDEWSCIAEKDGVFYTIDTNHGQLNIKRY